MHWIGGNEGEGNWEGEGEGNWEGESVREWMENFFIKTLVSPNFKYAEVLNL
jgi:hypothetical protein